MQSLKSLLIASLVYVVLESATTLAETPANCDTSLTTGCLNGNAYNYLDKKVCGQTLYDRSTTGCCHIATAFQYSTEFCCYGGVHPKSVGTCAKWTAELEEAAPACWDCSGRRLSDSGDDAESTDLLALEASVETETNVEADVESESGELVGGDDSSLRRRLDTWPSPFPFDTVASGASPTPCNSVDTDRGCYNTYTFYYATDYICENYLLKNDAYGCCDGIPYRFASETCCYLDDAYVVKHANHWCACTSAECVPTHAPTKSPVTPPTSQPTLTFSPTWEATEPPSSAPTHSMRPTALSQSNSAGDDDEVFRVNYLYGAAAVCVLGLGAVAYFQTRASKLIKERHEVALEIADTNY